MANLSHHFRYTGRDSKRLFPGMSLLTNELGEEGIHNLDTRSIYVRIEFSAGLGKES
jgi:hypothetical protein